MSTNSELIAVQLATAIQVQKIWGDIIYNAKAYGAKGDGVNDDSNGIQRAIDEANKDGGGTILFPTGVYRITSGLTTYSNIRLTGSGATILFDFSGNYGIRAIGTSGSDFVLTSNSSVGNDTLSVSSTTGINVGDTIQMQDSRNGTRRPWEIGIVKSLTSTTVTLYEVLSTDYKTSYTAKFNKLSGLENVSIDNLTLQCSDTSDIKFLIDIRYGKNIVVEKLKIINHRYATSPASLITVYIASCLNVYVSEIVKYGVKDSSLDSGDFISSFASQRVIISKNKGFSIAFGVGMWMGIANLIVNNQLHGSDFSGNRGIKVAGSYYCTVSENVVKYTDSGIKVEDSGKNNILDNTIMNCLGIGINCSSQFTSAEVEYVETNIADNRVSYCDIGIFTDTQCLRANISNNSIDHVTGRGIISTAADANIEGNRVTESGDTAFDFKAENTIVANNHAYCTSSSIKSFKVNNAVSPLGLIFTGNIAPNNPVDTSVDFNTLGSIGDNYISGFKNRHTEIIPLRPSAFGATGNAVTSSTFTVQGYKIFPGKLKYSPNAVYTLVIILGVDNVATTAEYRLASDGAGTIYGTASCNLTGRNLIRVTLSNLPTTEVIIQEDFRSTDNVNNSRVYSAHIEVSW